MNMRLFNRFTAAWAGVILLLLMVQGCMKKEESDLEKQARKDDEFIQQYLQNQNIQASKHDMGFYYVPLQTNNTGKAVVKGDIVSVYYRASLLNGRVIDSLTVSQGAPAKFRHASNALVPSGLDAGIALMRQGEKYRFILPSGLAYSSFSKNGLIDPYAVVVVDAELVEVLSNAEQTAIEEAAIEQYAAEKGLETVQKMPSGIYYNQTQAGTGELPKTNQTVVVHYVGKYLNGTEFDRSKSNQPYPIRIGANESIKGFEEGVKLMRKGEKATIFIPSRLAYDHTLQILPTSVRNDIITYFNLQSQLKVPPFSVLVFDLEVMEIQ